MDIIKLTRELGKAIQADERYTGYLAAKEANDNDATLQTLIGEFNMGRMKLNREMSSENKDEAKVSELNTEIRRLYGEIMTNEHMIAYNEAKAEMDKLLDQITTIITLSANGEDPETCSAEQSCSGNCSSCGGCH